MAKCEPKCKVLDYSLPLVPYRPFTNASVPGGNLGASVPLEENVDLNALAPAIGDTATVPFEIVGLRGCTLPAELDITRLTGGNQSTLLNTVGSAINNLGADDWRFTIRFLPDCFGAVPLLDVMLQPSQMGGTQERFVIQLGIDSPPDDYLDGPGNSTPVNLPLTANLVWGNNNNTGNSSFLYEQVSSVTWRMNGQNNVSNLVRFGIVNGPDILEYETCDILDLVKRINTGTLTQTLSF